MEVQPGYIYKSATTRNNWKVSHVTDTHITLEELEAGGKLVKSPTGDFHVVPAKTKTVTRETFEHNVNTEKLIPNAYQNYVTNVTMKHKEKAAKPAKTKKQEA